MYHGYAKERIVNVNELKKADEEREQDNDMDFDTSNSNADQFLGYQGFESRDRRSSSEDGASDEQPVQTCCFGLIGRSTLKKKKKKK